MVEKKAVTSSDVTVYLASCYHNFEMGGRKQCKKFPHLPQHINHLAGLAKSW